MGRTKDGRISVPVILRERLDSTHEPGPDLSLPTSGRAPSPDAVDVWETLGERLDLSLLRPKLVSDVEIRLFRLRWGNDYAMIANPRRMIHFQLEVWEAELAQQMDGTRSVAEIVVEHLEGTGDLDASAVTDLVTFLRREGFLEPLTVDVPAAVGAAIRPTPTVSDRILNFAKTLRIDWTGADRHVRWWYTSPIRRLFSTTGACVTALIAVGGFIAFLFAHVSGRYAIGQANAPLDSLIILALGFVLTYAHELGHALVLVHFDRGSRAPVSCSTSDRRRSSSTHLMG